FRPVDLNEEAIRLDALDGALYDRVHLEIGRDLPHRRAELGVVRGEHQADLLRLSIELLDDDAELFALFRLEAAAELRHVEQSLDAGRDAHETSEVDAADDGAEDDAALGEIEPL